MTEVSYQYSKLRGDFGKPAEFQANEPEQIIDVAPSDDLKNQFIFLDPYEVEIQNVAQLTDSQTNTERITTKQQGQLHAEGGWPRDIDPTEFDDKAKHCKKAERDESYFGTVKGLIERHMEKFLKQNNAIDIYGSYFADAPTETSLGPPSLKTVTVFKDPSPVKRTVCQVSWQADGKRLAAAYCNVRFQSSWEGMSNSSYVWDVLNPNEPCETLTPQSPLTAIEFSGKDQHVVAGGSYNGVLQWWDIRAPSRIVGKTAIEESHKDPIWDLKWLQSKSGEILTVSTDGMAYIWDCRRPEKATETVVIKKIESETLVLQPRSNEGGAKGVLGGVCIDYDAQVGGPAKYMVGTEQGTVLNCNRKGKTMQDKIAPNTFNGHHGPVYSVQRNPQHSKYFMTVGDWTVRLWFEDFKGPAMYSTFYHKAHLTSGCWHPLRAGVFFTTRMDGCIDVWDLMYRQSLPVLTTQVSDYALHTIKSTVEGKHIAVGGVDGTTTLLELSPSLYTPGGSEKATIGRMFENESTRDKNLQTRAKEKAQKALKKSQSRQSDRESGAVDETKLQEATEKFLRDVEAEEANSAKELEAIEAKRSKLLEDIEEGVEMDDEAA